MVAGQMKERSSKAGASRQQLLIVCALHWAINSHCKPFILRLRSATHSQRPSKMLMSCMVSGYVVMSKTTRCNYCLTNMSSLLIYKRNQRDMQQYGNTRKSPAKRAMRKRTEIRRIRSSVSGKRCGSNVE